MDNRLPPAAPGDSVGQSMVHEKGGESMEKPIRYYITTSGEESTVRSVRVARGAPETNVSGDAEASTSVAPAKSMRHVPSQISEVKRRVKDAIARRPSDR